MNYTLHSSSNFSSKIVCTSLTAECRVGRVASNYGVALQIPVFASELWFVRGSVHHTDVQRLRALEVHVGVATEGGLHARVHVALLRTHHHACTQTV